MDTQKFSPLVDGAGARMQYGIAPQCPLIGMVGNLCPGKGQEHFLEAAPLILRRYPQSKLVIVGARLENRRAFWEALQRQAARLQLGRDVIFTGRRSDVPQLLGAITVFVQPSESESCSMTTLEACACGRPVVATAVGGTPEIVEDGVTGILIEPREPAQIARAVLRLLEAPDAAREMGLAAARRMQERFSLEACVETHARMYDAVAQRARGALPATRAAALPATEAVDDVYSRN